jgi:predicted nucleic acid-binding protein
MYLLDTPIVAELRKAKTGQTDQGLIGWAAGVAQQNLFISALCLLELETGVAQAERRDKVAAEGLRTWLDTHVPRAFEGRVLAVDGTVARRRAQVAITDARDALMAATAQVHGLTIVTRNVAAFKSGKVKLFNPWGFRPDAAADDTSDWREGTRTGPLWFKNLFLRF